MSQQAQMDPALNRCPETVHHIHLIGICGTGMAALAGMLKQQGYRVTGSDQNVYPPMSDFLASCDIPIMEGYRAENLEPVPDLVVVGNVVRAVNPEAVSLAEEKKIHYLSMPQALATFFLRGKRSLVVAGNHGKTTTSSMLATALHKAGSIPGFMIGGLVEAFGRNFNISEEPFFVVEGDEYDTAFFNKVSKFQHYFPECAILTSVEFDHADIFSSIEDIKASFREFIARIPKHGVLVANYDDPLVAELAEKAQCTIISYGLEAGNQYRIKGIQANGLSTAFTLETASGEIGPLTIPMPGKHNVMNATAVMALMTHLGFSSEMIANGLACFEGVKRRQQVRGCEAGVTVIDDFAHHPTAVQITVSALKESYPHQRLIIVFEPRTNSSRRSVFQSAYADSFEQADLVIIREHIPLDTIPRSEQFSSTRLVKELNDKNITAAYFPDTEMILSHLLNTVRDGDVVAILSNGGFDNIHERLLSMLHDNVTDIE